MRVTADDGAGKALMPPRLGNGFFVIMAAQFFSSLADNALLVAAVELLTSNGAPSWQVPALAPIFALFYVVLAPLVGAFADALPKGRVMIICNSIKVAGCLLMFFGAHPLLAYAIVGLGAAAYAPAKYGLVTELLPACLLVKGNGWIEGLTIVSIIAGIWLGGQLISPSVPAALLQFDFPLVNTSLRSPAELAITFIVVIYFIAALFNLFIPRSRAALCPINRRAGQLLADFADCNARLWRDKLGQITLATTTLLWGIFGNLRVIIFAWAAAALGFGTVQAVNLAGAVVVGSIAGAVLAAYTVSLSRALALMPLASAVGVLMIGLNMIDTAAVAMPFLAILGAICGFLIVPMNALLQHRGSSVMGAGCSIAVQGFNEQACVLLLGAIYASMTWAGMPVFGTIAIFGLFIVCAMEYIRYRHRQNCARHGSEIEQSLMATGASEHS